MPTKALISISSMKVDKDSVRSILSSSEKTKLDTLAIVMNLVSKRFDKRSKQFGKIEKMRNWKSQERDC